MEKYAVVTWLSQQEELLTTFIEKFRQLAVVEWCFTRRVLDRVLEKQSQVSPRTNDNGRTLHDGLVGVTARQRHSQDKGYKWVWETHHSGKLTTQGNSPLKECLLCVEGDSPLGEWLLCIEGDSPLRECLLCIEGDSPLRECLLCVEGDSPLRECVLCIEGDSPLREWLLCIEGDSPLKECLLCIEGDSPLRECVLRETHHLGNGCCVLRETHHSGSGCCVLRETHHSGNGCCLLRETHHSGSGCCVLRETHHSGSGCCVLRETHHSGRRLTTQGVCVEGDSPLGEWLLCVEGDSPLREWLLCVEGDSPLGEWLLFIERDSPLRECLLCIEGDSPLRECVLRETHHLGNGCCVLRETHHSGSGCCVLRETHHSGNGCCLLRETHHSGSGCCVLRETHHSGSGCCVLRETHHSGNGCCLLRETHHSGSGYCESRGVNMQRAVATSMNSRANKRYGLFSPSIRRQHSSVEGKVIAVRREDQSVWERRAPLAPANVRRLTRAGVKVIVQPSNRRAYPMQDGLSTSPWLCRCSLVPGLSVLWFQACLFSGSRPVCSLVPDLFSGSKPVCPLVPDLSVLWFQAYSSAGAVVQEDISEASIIFGVKQVPVDLLLPNKTYCLFSHTIKAQEANMPLLDAILEKLEDTTESPVAVVSMIALSGELLWLVTYDWLHIVSCDPQNIRLIDYEKLMDESGQRVVAFGKYAGLAGMVNILHGLGLRLLALGHHTPFMVREHHIGPAHNYRNSSMARQAIRDAGYEIALGMMPQSIGPLTFVFTGSGNVSQGCQELFQELPHEYVPPEMLKKVAEHGGRRVEGSTQSDYDQFPSRYISTFSKKRQAGYISTFSKKIAPYASVIINGIYWAVDSPKLLTLPDAKYLLRPANTPWIPSSVGSPALPHRMLAICDISADPGGSIEFMNECTTIDTPFCLYDADRNKDSKSFKGPGVLVCSIDNMPTQLPLESTDFFGELLYPYAMNILQSDAMLPLEQHNFLPAVHGAIIASNGKLTPNFEYIQELRTMSTRSWHKAGSPREDGCRRIVLLGAGYVSAPVVQYLHKEHNVHITVASALKDEADAIASIYQQSVEPVLLDVLERPDTLQDLVSSADVVVSLLPSPLHHLVAECCIEQGVHMVTASYCTKEMMELHQRAVEAGVTIVNEVGLDPGIDHLLAMECIDEVHQAGGKVESFVSYCGGLPAPEYSDNALRYKFSWNPKGVLLNTLSTAKYINNGQEIIIPGGGQLMKEAHKLKFLPGFNLEGFPNRDSTHYASLYKIANEAHTVLRGTLRFQGFCDTVQGMQSLGLFDTNPHPALHPKGPEITWVRQYKHTCMEFSFISAESHYSFLLSPYKVQCNFFIVLWPPPLGTNAVFDLGALLSCPQRQLVCNLLGQSDSTIFYENLKRQLLERVGGSGTFRVEALESLGLLEDIHVIKLNTPLDTLSHFLSKRLAMGEA
uniref:Lysine ketoglutarate reductase n=1 Tax=Timema bartmani TaxID=61472 RepID=A0A7R9HYS3_9NEOP|nr:unnamed protein product [Timema bartmani]